MSRFFRDLKRSLEEAIDDTKNGKTYTTEEVFAHVRKHIKRYRKFPYKQLYFISNRAKRAWWKIGDWWYYAKCWLFHRYNVIKVKTLSPTWHDRDNVLLHASFQIFVDFMEKERPFETIEYDYTDEINRAMNEKEKQELQVIHERKQKVKKELEYLYDWWKNKRNQSFDAIDKAYSNWKPLPAVPTKEEEELGAEESDKITKMEDNAYEADTEHLIRLMKMRQELWT